MQWILDSRVTPHMITDSKQLDSLDNYTMTEKITMGNDNEILVTPISNI